MFLQFRQRLLAGFGIAVTSDHLSDERVKVVALIPTFIVPVFDDMGLLFSVVIVPGLAVIQRPIFVGIVVDNNSCPSSGDLHVAREILPHLRAH